MQSSLLHDLFDQAVDLPVEERDRFLRERCGDDAKLRAAVEGLIRAHERADQFLADPTVPADWIFPPESPVIGTKIGPYTLLRRIGEGGYGTVYEAEQIEPLRRRVAVKVIKSGMDSRRVILRFAREREALALMEHPHIARVLDAGTTEQGRPYFVMELVDGRPITEYCKTHALNVRQRLALFTDVCSAVQHAHQKGIIHRDLKPGNILVTEQGGRPECKVIDFGIAKALHAQADQIGQTTEQPQLIGSVPYMSPEQAQHPPVQLDTRSDIYSLGVLLYEMLADCPPFDPVRLRSAANEEMQRIIREVDPPPPSQALATLTEALPRDDASLRTESRKRSQEIRDDLDWIVMKAMEKDRERRYATADALAADICKYLADEPVAAGPPSKIYLFRKFARRNRNLLATVVIVLVALTLGLTLATIGLIRARRSAISEANQRNLADQQRGLAEASAKAEQQKAQELMAAQRALYALITPNPKSGNAPREVLDFVVSRANDGRFDGFPSSEAPLRAAVGQGYRALNQWHEAAREFRRGVEAERRCPKPWTPNIASGLMMTGECLMYGGEYDEAEKTFWESLEIYTQANFKGPYLYHRAYVAAIRVAKGDLAGAAQLLQEARERMKITPSTFDLLAPMESLAEIREDEGRRDIAQNLRTFVANARQKMPPPAAAVDKKPTSAHP